MLKILVPLCIALTCILGCDPPPLCSAPVAKDLNKFPPASPTLKVHVFLDGTTSMKGFIVPGVTSRYQQVLPLLESTVERGWSGSQISFYRFGTVIEELPDRKYLEAQHEKFYEQNEIRARTLIQNVIDFTSQENSDNSLTAIVTDLFQTDVDVNLISRKIKENFITKNLSVGIVGIKSQFNGKVYDVGPNNYAFDYKTDNSNPTSFRPFYILVLGKHADVSNYFEAIFKGGLEPGPETHALILSPYLSENVATFEDSFITETQKIQEINNLLPPDADARHVRQFRIPDSSVQQSSFKANLGYKPLPYVMSVASPELDSEVTAFQCGASAEANGSHTLNEADGIKRAFTVKGAYLNETAIDYTAEIIPAALQGRGIYCFKNTLRPKTYKMPDWVSAWDMDSGLVEAWRSSPRDFNGATTFNLKALLVNLWENTLQAQRPIVAELYSYVEKK
jgi:hypothetical protein